MRFRRNNMVVLLFLLAIGMMVFSGCKKEEKGKVIVKVGKSTLTVEELLSQIPPQLLVNTSPQNRSRILEEWMAGELMYQDALRQGFDKQPVVSEQLKQLKKQIITQAYIQDLMAASSFVSEDEAMAYFNEHEDEYNTVIEVSHISLNSVGMARTVLKELEDGRSFSSLARKYSADSSTAIKGGYFGSLRKGDLERLPLFETHAFSLEKVKDITPIVQTEFGYDIIRLLSRKKSRKRIGYADVSESIKMALRQQKTQRRYESLIDSLKNEIAVELHPEILEQELGISMLNVPIMPVEQGE